MHRLLRSQVETHLLVSVAQEVVAAPHQPPWPFPVATVVSPEGEPVVVGHPLILALRVLVASEAVALSS